MRKSKVSERYVKSERISETVTYFFYCIHFFKLNTVRGKRMVACWTIPMKNENIVMKWLQFVEDLQREITNDESPRHVSKNALVHYKRCKKSKTKRNTLFWNSYISLKWINESHRSKHQNIFFFLNQFYFFIFRV